MKFVLNDSPQELLIEDNEIKERCECCFDQLFSSRYKINILYLHSFAHNRDYSYTCRIRPTKVFETVKNTRTKKAHSLNGIPIEFGNVFGEVEV